MSAVLEEFPLARWQGPFGVDLRAPAQAALESGKVLYFPQLVFPLEKSEEEFLCPAIADSRVKNISLDPQTGKLQGTTLTGARAERLAAMIERFGRQATGLVEQLFPGYAGLERARTSFRPVEIEGRAYSPINDDRLLHVDAFFSRPMRGRRILRLFANVAPPSSGNTRLWNVGEPFTDFARHFLPRVRPALPGTSWLYEKLGLTQGRRSRYDETMLALHNAAKRDADYQRGAPHHALEFPPGSAWLVYTDQVLHAALGGAFALEQTFHLDVAAMARPELSPLKLLERLSGLSLA